MKNKFKDFFPTDRFSFEDLEVFPCGDKKVAFTQGYYFCPLLPKGDRNVIEFKRIENTFIPQDEKPEKFFELEEKIPKHFYLKVVLDSKPIRMESLPYNEDEESYYSQGLEPKYYPAKSVEVSDDTICKPGDVGYPFFETVSKATELPTFGIKDTLPDFPKTIVYNPNHPGPYSKKTNIFYIYLCSLYLEDNEISRLFYYMTKGSKDPSILVPDPIKQIISNRHQTDKENDKIVAIRNSIGERVYKTTAGAGSKDYKQIDFGNDKSNIFNDIKYNKRNETYQNIYLDSNELTSRVITDSKYLKGDKFVPHQTFPKEDGIPAYQDDRYSFSPYPIIGVSEVKQVRIFVPDDGNSPIVIG